MTHHCWSYHYEGAGLGAYQDKGISQLLYSSSIEMIFPPKTEMSGGLDGPWERCTLDEGTIRILASLIEFVGFQRSRL
jgi:hypothetical protein